MTDPAPFLPDPEALRPPGVDVDPDAELAALGWSDDDPDADMPAARVLAEQIADDDGVWRIGDEGAAEWAMARLARARANLAQLVRQRAAYEDRIAEWTRKASAPVLRDATWFEAQLILWAMTRRSEAKGSAKTFRLPSGEVGTTKASDWRPSIDDPQLLLEWALDARDHGTNIVRSRLLLDVLAASLQAVAEVQVDDEGDALVVHKATGEVIPGAIAARTEARAKVTTYEAD